MSTLTAPATPPIPTHMQDRFETILRAARAGDLALMSCLDARTSEPRFVICAVNSAVGADGDSFQYEMVPLGHLTPDDNPYDAYTPPA